MASKETRLNLPEAERIARLRLLRTPSVGAATFHAVIQRFGSASKAIAHWSAISRRLRRDQPATLPAQDVAERELKAINTCGASLIAHDEPDYPALLAATENPPPFIIAKGRRELLGRPSLAIVGSRNASAIGQRYARNIATDIGAAGLVIVSGLARGIDTAAHRGSLPTGTIAVMAGGIDIVYPPENENLHAQIGDTGLLVSEVPCGQQPTAQHFPRRNRIISGLSHGVLVVEATLNSGSLITARLAGEQGRDVFAVPGSPLDPRATGTNALLRQGAILTETADDVLMALTFEHGRNRPPQPRREPCRSTLPEAPPPEDLQSEILARLSATPVETDELVRQTGATAASVSAALLDLEFAGLLTRHPGQRVSSSQSC
jgi:DNA processing protein